MKKIRENSNQIILLLSLIMLPTFYYAQNFDWVNSMGGTQNVFGKSIDMDSAGNLFSTGTFIGVADFDPSASIFNLTSQGAEDFYVQKLDANGNFLWAKSIGGTGYDVSVSIKVVDDGVYISGRFDGSVDFDPNAGVFIQPNTGGPADFFILKLDLNGNFVWVKSIENVIPTSMDVDSEYIYSSGYFSTTGDFDPGAGIASLSSNGVSDVFILKLDASNGTFEWAKSFGGTDMDFAYAIVADLAGNVYSTGTYSGVADFDPDIGNYSLSASGYRDGFVHKLDSLGNFIWVKTMGGDFMVEGVTIDVDADLNVCTAGWFKGTADFNPNAGVTNFISFNWTPTIGTSDVFVQKLDAFGNFLWANQLAGPYGDEVFSLQFDDFGNVYTTGWSEDVFVQKMDDLGNILWSRDINSIGRSIALDDKGSVYITGEYIGTVDFDPNIGVYNLTSVGTEFNSFVLKLVPCDNVIYTTSECSPFTWIDGNDYYVNNNTATYVLTNSAGCDSLITLDLTINLIDLTTSMTDSTIQANLSGASYQWLDCNMGYSPILGETNQEYVVDANGSYAVEITFDGCTDTSDCSVFSSLDLIANKLFSEINLYPNPSNGELTIDLQSLTNVEIQLYNNLGQLVESFYTNNDSLVHLSLNLKSGIYFLKMKIDSIEKCFKVVLL